MIPEIERFEYTVHQTDRFIYLDCSYLLNISGQKVTVTLHRHPYLLISEAVLTKD